MTRYCIRGGAGDRLKREKPRLASPNTLRGEYHRNLMSLTSVPTIDLNMGYQALLFCPDEKTARTVTQVLSELDFAVIACAEPFAAVKKLMGERFDAVVVDCDNEQNATLLFKSARNAANNQSSLAVAVVEGQAGVAKAFRMGANLVLTKPINVEQAKGTLRVARGLLRKGEAAKSAATAAPKPVPSPAASQPLSPATPRAESLPPQNKPPQPVVVASASAVTASGTTGSGALPAAENASSRAVKVPGQPSAPKTAAQTPRKIVADSSAPILIDPETGEVKAEEPQPKKSPLSSPEFPAPPANFGFAPKPSSSSAASAAAPAREKKVSAESGAELPASVAQSASVAEQEVPGALKDESSTSAPTLAFGALAGNDDKPSSRSKLLIVLVVLLLLAAAGYLASTQFGGKIKLPSWVGTQLGTIQGAVSKTSSAQAPRPAAPAVPAQSKTPDAAPQIEPIQVSPEKPSSAVGQVEQSQPGPIGAVVKPPKVSDSTPVARSAGSASAAAPPIVVKNSRSSPVRRPTPVSDAPPPVVAGMSASTDSESIADLAGKSASPTPVLEAPSISQGLTQGVVLKKVQPKYPAAALQMRIEGPVRLLATITKDGGISAVKILHGDPQLARAAADAVKQWKYKPYSLNGEPVEIQTEITVDFKLPQ